LAAAMSQSYIWFGLIDTRDLPSGLNRMEPAELRSTVWSGADTATAVEIANSITMGSRLDFASPNNEPRTIPGCVIGRKGAFSAEVFMRYAHWGSIFSRVRPVPVNCGRVLIWLLALPFCFTPIPNLSDSHAGFCYAGGLSTADTEAGGSSKWLWTKHFLRLSFASMKGNRLQYC